MRKLSVLAMIVALVAWMMVPESASAANCGDGVATCVCGDTVVADTTLDSDLTCTTTPGLIIGAADITIDLDGHTLSSGGVFCAFCHGVRNGDSDPDPEPFQAGTSVGFDDVTIKNGTIDGFEQGIRGWKVSEFKIEDVTLTGQASSNAIDVIDSEDVKVENVTIVIPASSGAEGIRLESVEDAKVEKVSVTGGSVGVNFACAPCPDDEGPTTGAIEDSTFTGNGNGILLAETTDAKVEDNVVSGTGGTGILVGLGFLSGFPAISGVKLEENEVSGSVSGSGIVLVKTTSSTVEENMSTGNAGNGIRLILSSTGNEIEENTATGNTGVDMFHDGTSTPNTWEENTCGTSSGADIDCP